MEQMRADMLAMHAGMQQQQAAFAHQVRVLQAAAAAVVPPPHGPSLRIAPPALYNGAAPPLDDWLSAMEQQFDYYRIAADGDRIRTAAAHLKGPALDWWRHPGAAGPPTTWASFDAGLRARFQPVTTEEVARNRIHSLEQGKLSINEYVALFRRLIVAIPTMDAASQMFQFARGLRPALQLQIRQTQPATLEASISLAVRMGTALPGATAGSSDSAMELSAMDHGLDNRGSWEEEATVSRAEYSTLLAAIQQSNFRGNNGSGSDGRGARGASGGFRGPRGLPRIKGFSEDKVKQYMDAGKCFGCERTDHRSHDCPKRRVGTDGRVTWDPLK